MSPAIKAAVKALEAERQHGTPESYEAAKARLAALLDAEGYGTKPR